MISIWQDSCGLVVHPREGLQSRDIGKSKFRDIYSDVPYPPVASQQATNICTILIMSRDETMEKLTYYTHSGYRATCQVGPHAIGR